MIARVTFQPSQLFARSPRCLATGPDALTVFSEAMGSARAPILIVNDDEAVNDALWHVLEKEGFGVEVATDGRNALARLREGLRPGLILLDLMMPVMDGYEFREQQLKIPELAEIPVVVMSSVFGVRLDAVRSLQVNGYVDVPVELPNLLQIVRQHYRAP